MKRSVAGILLACLILVAGCTPKSKHKNEGNLHAHIPYLYVHEGTKNYEIVKLKYLGDIHYDTKKRHFYYKNDTLLFKINYTGIFIDSVKSMKNDQSIDFYPEKGNGPDYYSNWVKTGDTTVHEYINIFPEEKWEDRDSARYMQQHLKFYADADQVHYYYYNYYYHIKGKWYRLNPFGISVKKEYPEKRIPDSRISGTKTMDSIFHEGQWYVLLHPIGMEREYFPTASHRVQTGGVKGSFTSGYWLLKIPLPGDTLVFKRKYDQMGPGLDFTKAPGQYGGTDSVLFIEERTPTTPIEMTEEEIKVFKQQHGGTYLIRPRRK